MESHVFWVHSRTSGTIGEVTEALKHSKGMLGKKLERDFTHAKWWSERNGYNETVVKCIHSWLRMELRCAASMCNRHACSLKLCLKTNRRQTLENCQGDRKTEKQKYTQFLHLLRIIGVCWSSCHEAREPSMKLHKSKTLLRRKDCILGISVGWNVFNFCKATNHRMYPNFFLIRFIWDQEHSGLITSPNQSSISTNNTVTNSKAAFTPNAICASQVSSFSVKSIYRRNQGSCGVLEYGAQRIGLGTVGFGPFIS